MNETAIPSASIAPIQIVSPFVGPQRPGRGAALVDLRGLAIEEAGGEQMCEIVGRDARNRRTTRSRIADARLDRLDQRMRVFESIDASGRPAARRGRAASARRAPASAPACCRASPSSACSDERLAPVGAVGLQVGARHRRADALEIGRDLARDVAAIEIVEPGVGELRERVGEARRLADRPRRGRLAVEEIRSRRSPARRRASGWSSGSNRVSDGETGTPSRASRSPRSKRIFSGNLPPSAAESSSASAQPPIVPGTVSAAFGPRVGIAS